MNQYSQFDMPFPQNSAFKNHMRIHIGERLYQCIQCGKAFFSCTIPIIKRKLMLIHMDERPYKGRYCEKAFSSNSYFKTHMWINNEERPYHCSQ